MTEEDIKGAARMIHSKLLRGFDVEYTEDWLRLLGYRFSDSDVLKVHRKVVGFE